jgi:DNA polymerase
MPKKPEKKLTFAIHKERWKDCTACSLCKTRNKVVLLRGTVPAPILFIGEAPGLVENVFGVPFKGPAGKLLDSIIEAAGLIKSDYALTNIIACVPLSEGNALDKPPIESVKACKDRLCEAIDLVKPDLIINVGQQAEKWFSKQHLGDRYDIPHVVINHPAYLLRLGIAQQGLEIQRCIIQIKDAISDYVVPF